MMEQRRGQSTAEHGLAIALVAILVIGSLLGLGAVTSGSFNSITSSIAGVVAGGPPPTATPSPTPSAPPAGVVTVSPANPSAGQDVTVSGSGFIPGGAVQVVLHSNPVLLGTVNADGAGDVSTIVTLPASTSLGLHTITLVGYDRSGAPLTLTSASFTVSANPLILTPSITSGPLYSLNYLLAAYDLAAGDAGGTAPVSYAWSGPGGWSAGGATPASSFTCSDLPTTLDLAVSDAVGHHADATVFLAGCPAPVASGASAGTPSYAGNYTSATVALTGTNASGGVAPYAYAWSGPDSFTSPVQNPSATIACSALNGGGSVSLTASDANGEAAGYSVSLAACPGPLSAGASAPAPSYTANYTDATYAFTGTASGGDGSPLSYAWTGPGSWTASTLSPGHTFACADLTGGGTATLTVSDGTGSLAATVSLAACPAPLAGATASLDSGPLYSANYTIAGDNFAATAATGGTSPYAYAWSGPGGWTDNVSGQAPATTFDCTALVGGGTVTLTVSDAHGQTLTRTVSLDACPGELGSAPAAGTMGTGPAYDGNYTHATYDFAVATATGGLAPYAYAWTGPGGWSTSGQSVSHAFACTDLSGSLTLTTSDANGATVSSSTTLAACPGPLSGSASASTPVYAANYTSATYDFGSSAAGGASPYLLTWSGPGSFTSGAATPSHTFACSTLTGGASVSLEIADANNQTITRTVALAACPGALGGATASLSGVPLYNNDNYATVTDTFAATAATGGTAPYAYAWSGPGGWTDSVSGQAPATTFDCTALLGGGTVTLTVSDAHSQSITRTVSLAACPAPLGGTASASAPAYSGNYTSAAYDFSSTTSGGDSPTTTWSGPGSFTSSAPSPSHTFACSSLPGTVTLTIGDTNGQSVTRTVDLAACPGPLSAGASAGAPTYATNYTSATYALTGSASGGDGSALTTSWSGPGSFTSSSLSPGHSFLCAALPGPATLTVSDGTQSTSATVSLAACPVALAGATASLSGVPLYGGNYLTAGDTFATTAATGGSGSYTYAWSGPGVGGFASNTSGVDVSTTFTCSDLPGSGVSLTVTDTASQSITRSVSLAACPAQVGASAAKSGPSAFSGPNYTSATYSFTGTGSGGSGTLTYAWTGIITSSSQSPSAVSITCAALSGGAHTATLTVSDANGQNTSANTVSLAACPVALGATAAKSGPSAYTGNYTSATYSFTGTGSGGSGTLTYAWTGIITSSSQSPSAVSITCAALSGGAHTATLTVSDANGQNTSANTVSLAACPVALGGGTAVVNAGPSYSGNYANAQYTFTETTVTGGSGSYTYAWTGPSPLPSSSLTPIIIFACSSLVGGKTVTLTITDSNNQTITRTVSLVACPAPVYPTVAGRTVGHSAVTSPSITLPGTAAAGDLLIVHVAYRYNVYPTTPTGWSLLSQGSASSLQGATYYKTAAGGETAVTCGPFGTIYGVSWVTLRISAGTWSGTPELGYYIGGAVQNPDPPALSPSWGSRATLWLAFADTQIGWGAATAAPSGFSNLQADSGGVTYATNSAELSATTATEDPGYFTWPGYAVWSAITFAIRPVP